MVNVVIRNLGSQRIAVSKIGEHMLFADMMHKETLKQFLARDNDEGAMWQVWNGSEIEA